MSQLFTQQHYDTFMPPKPFEDDAYVRLEREHVKDQFLWLDESLAPFIEDRGWDLHRHHQPQHYTSSTHFIWRNVDTGEVDDRENPIGRWQPIVKEIGWLWLHYGKSWDQLNFYKDLPGVYQYSQREDKDYSNAFYVHTRIQFYLSFTYFGVWLVYTDKNRYDKSEFLKNLRTVPIFEATYWNRLQPLLNQGFCYVVDDEELPLNSNLDRERLFKFIRSSYGEGYSGIRKKYEPDAFQIGVENIIKEMQMNLILLYPLYELMAHRQQIPKVSGINTSSFFGGNVRVK
jgi:hypothetical protein